VRSHWVGGVGLSVGEVSIIDGFCFTCNVV
jgi:hypothetical protein